MAAACVGSHAFAHAVLVDSVPADGSAVASSPTQIELRFNEEVVVLAVEVVDASTVVQQPGAVPIREGEHVRLPLTAPLADGGYLVKYRVTSADSHVIDGAIAFAVGHAAIPARATRAGSHWTAWFTATRALRDIAILLVAGLGLYLAIVGPFPFAARWSAVAAVAAGITSIVALGLQGFELAGARSKLFDPGSFRIIPPAIAIATAATIVASAVIALASRAPARSLHRAMLVSCPLLMAVAHVAVGHAMTSSSPRAAFVVLTAHVLGAAFWLGSLAALLYLLVRAPTDRGIAALRRFSRIAIVAVPVFIAAGVAGAFLEVPSITALISSVYGQLLMAKAALVVPLIALAGANRNILLPALARGESSARGRLAKTIVVELAVVLGIVGIAAQLGRTPPPRAHPVADLVERRLVSGNLEAAIAVRRAGSEHTVEVEVTRAGTTDRVDVPEMTIEFSNAAAGVTGIQRPMSRMAPGVYRWRGVAMPVPGTWSIAVHALVDDFTRTTFRFDVALPGNAHHR
jgi:copper transport protein